MRSYEVHVCDCDTPLPYWSPDTGATRVCPTCGVTVTLGAQTQKQTPARPEAWSERAGALLAAAITTPLYLLILIVTIIVFGGSLVLMVTEFLKV